MAIKNLSTPNNNIVSLYHNLSLRFARISNAKTLIATLRPVNMLH